MPPILASCGGRFGHDFAVTHVLQSIASDRIHRVFAISFPSAEMRAAFYADPAYQRVRAEHYEPAVVSAHRFAMFVASEA